jgi:shikimate dehydrogenase
MKLSGHTTPYAVLGHPIGHSLSPVMHNASFDKLGLDAIYLAFDIEPGRLMNALPALRDLGFDGVNLTVPLKETAFNGLSELDASAQRAGAVNTVQFLDDGTIKGHSTDARGFLLSIEEEFSLSSLKGKKVFVLGTGGAGRTLALTCADEGAETVMLGDVEIDRAKKVASEISGSSSSATAEADDADAWKEFSQEADLVIQSTPVGMKPDDTSLLKADAFHEGQFVYDLVYMYPETSFLKEAKLSGARTANGLGMLLHQGAHAFTIWTGQQASIDVMRKALETEVYG